MRIEEIEEEWECVLENYWNGKGTHDSPIIFAEKWFPGLFEIAKSIQRADADYRSSQAYRRHAENVIFEIHKLEGKKKDDSDNSPRQTESDPV